MPDEFEGNQQEATPPGEPVEAHELTMDDLFALHIEHEQVKQAEKAMLLPIGTYTTQPPLKVKLSKVEETGRPFARFFGPAVFGEVRGYVGFGLSWEFEERMDPVTKEGTGKPDRLYQNYVQAISAYKRAYGAEPENPGAVVEYLRDYPVRLRLIQIGVPTDRNPNPTGEPGNMVVSISPVVS